ncbi:MAG: hypothetical protein IT423_21960 [Pirellulaceae bacterium]|nr:hypothetical protein [Pirellulaceae bacterium]
MEPLQARAVLAAQAFLNFDSPISELAINTFLDSSLVTGSEPQYRQISMVVDNSIMTTGLHPQGTSLGTTSQSMVLPTGAVDAVIEKAWDADTGIGFATFADARTEAILWINANLSVALGNVVPLAGYQRSDASVVVVFESNPSIRVVRYGTDGSVLNSVSLDGEIYSSAKATADGIVLMGTDNALPVAAWIDENFAVTETALTLPAGASFAGPVGISRSNGQNFYTGSTIVSAGTSRLVLWDMQGNLVEQGGFENLWAIKASGYAILVDDDAGYAVIVRDQALASLLGIELDTPAAAADLDILQGRGFTTMTLTDALERDGEIYLGIVATDANGVLMHGIVAATLGQFPSAWQYFRNPLDVNVSGVVTPLDALLVINELNGTGPRVLSASDLALIEANGQPRWDVNGDGVVSAIDALLVINFLNNQAVTGEGEATTTSDVLAMPVDEWDRVDKLTNRTAAQWINRWSKLR